MRRISFLLMLALAMPVAAQDDKAQQDQKPRKPATKPPVRRSARRPAHAKPTPEQIRRFNKLEKEEEQDKPGASGDAGRPK